MSDDLTRPHNAFEKSGNANTSDDPVKVLARNHAAMLALSVYGRRIANNIADGTIEHHHFIDGFEAAIRATVELAAKDLEAWNEGRPWENMGCFLANRLRSLSFLKGPNDA